MPTAYGVIAEIVIEIPECRFGKSLLKSHPGTGPSVIIGDWLSPQLKKARRSPSAQKLIVSAARILQDLCLVPEYNPCLLVCNGY